eukprot:8502669-Pyramimonas_sp.AAC.1
MPNGRELCRARIAAPFCLNATHANLLRSGRKGQRQNAASSPALTSAMPPHTCRALARALRQGGRT